LIWRNASLAAVARRGLSFGQTKLIRGKAAMSGSKLTRRHALKSAAAVAAALAAPRVAAQGARQPTKVLDFLTYADVAKAEQEGAFVFYCHENEAGTAAIAEGFGKDFPKIKASYVRAQTGALYNKILSERSAGRFEVDVVQLSDIAPAVDFEKRGGFELYVSPSNDAYRQEYRSATAGAYFWTGVTFGGLAYNKTKVKAEEAPKTYKDILNPRWRNKMSCKISASGIQYVQWYLLRQIYGNDFWKEYAKQRPRAFDSRVQLFDRLAKGDDEITSMAEYSAYVLYKSRGADVEFVAPPEGLIATPLVVGAVSKAPHPECAKLFVDWAMSERGQKFYQDQPNLYYGSVRDNPPPMPTGQKLSEYKLIFPTDWDDYGKQREVFNKEWNAMFGL
jgi:iron(III) transport system substrate-binding protein